MEKYDIISVVGEGSYGLVMRCRHRESGQYVAIKKFLETEDDPTVRKMAMREIRMLKKLRHENLVNMIEVFRRKKRFFLVFEYLEHTILEELEQRTNGLGYVVSRKYIFQVLRALDFIHSHQVIHRDIKPENVLVSKLGVIKLCDFGFARPYTENETFTDYVATRWYRSPELLVGDPRYGKEVDVWAVGCLYAEMITGEPLFPGESDIDQLFQIVRVLGKPNSRHQILLTRNSMFKGMKQEQNSSLLQLFPDWNRDCLDFLAQCLKMDSAYRPDTGKLLKHELFTRDNFLDKFLPELRAKINQEMQVNPLMKRMPSYGSGNRMDGDKKSSERGTTKKLSLDESKVPPNQRERNDRINHQIGLSLLTNQLLNPTNQKLQLIDQGSNNQRQLNPLAEEFNLNLSSFKHYLNSNNNNNSNSNSNNQQPLKISNANNSHNNYKPISINNLVFKESGKYTRILSAKPQKTVENSNQNNFDLHIQPSSPIHFQSLQPDNVTDTQISQVGQEVKQANNQKESKRLSPVGINQLSINGGSIPQYFSNQKRLNVSGLQSVTNKNTIKNSIQSQLNQLTSRQPLPKRDRVVPILPDPITTNQIDGITKDKDPSPRILPAPPSWLTGTGNVKITTHGKTTHQIGKRGIVTDWKSVGLNGKASENSTVTSDFLLPNVPGASPFKGTKKKLSPMSNFSQDNHYFGTPRNFSASSDHVNET